MPCSGRLWGGHYLVVAASCTGGIYADTLLAQTVLTPEPGLSAESTCATSATFAHPTFDGVAFGLQYGVKTDGEIAVGPCAVLAATNDGLKAYSKTGVLGLNRSLNAPPFVPSGDPPPLWEVLTQPPVGLYFLWDPEVYYDALAGRFWAVAAEADDLQSAPGPPFDRWYFALAVSKSSDPSALNPGGTPAWWKYRIDVTDVIPIGTASTVRLDAPSLATDAGHVALTAFTLEPPYVWYAVVLLDKASLLAGTAGNAEGVIDINPGDPRLLQPFQSGGYGALAPKFGPMDGTPFYLIRGDDYTDAAADGISIFAIRQDLSPPTTHMVTLGVSPYRRPAATAPQPESSFGIVTGWGLSFWSAVYRNGYLWATHGIRNPGGAEPETARVRWYQYAMNGWPLSGQTPGLFNWGELAVPSGIHAYLPSIAVDDLNNAAISFSVSGTAKHLSMWYAVKCASQSAFQLPVELKPGASSFNFEFSADYSGTDPDPAAATIFYTHNAIPQGSAQPATKWESWAMRFEAPCGLDADGDGVTTGGDLIAFVSLWQLARPEADYRGDGVVDLTDLASFQTDLYGPP